MALYFDQFDTFAGRAAAAVDEDGALVEFHFVREGSDGHLASAARATHDPARLLDVRQQVADFFERKRETFDLKLNPAGTPFQQKVWRALCDIPFGRTVSYQHIARQLGDINAVRAVGTANNRNPIALVIPCHRVIGKDGSMVGYGGGVALKRVLLDFESPPLL